MSLGVFFWSVPRGVRKTWLDNLFFPPGAFPCTATSRSASRSRSPQLNLYDEEGDDAADFGGPLAMNEDDDLYEHEAEDMVEADEEAHHADERLSRSRSRSRSSEAPNGIDVQLRSPSPNVASQTSPVTSSSRKRKLEETSKDSDGKTSSKAKSGSSSAKGSTPAKKAKTNGVENDKKDRNYFVLKSNSLKNLEISLEKGVWATQKRNETKLNKAFDVRALNVCGGFLFDFSATVACR